MQMKCFEATAEEENGDGAWIRGWEAMPPPDSYRESAWAPAVSVLAISAIKETGANRERAAEIMRVAESSCGFPIFGNGRSSRGCGFTDSSRASWSCRESRSPHFKDIYLCQDEERLYSQGVTGASSQCLHTFECTCSRSSTSRFTADVKVTTAVQLSAVVAVEGGGSGSGHWMTSVADEGHLDPLAETSQGRSRQELWCLCKQYLSVFTWWKPVCFVCLCMRVPCSHIHPSLYNTGSVWHGSALPGDDEKLNVVISYGCQVLGRVPYHLPLTHWNKVFEHTSVLNMTR